MPQPTQLNASIWDENESWANKLPFQPVNWASIDDLINVLMQIKPLSYLRPLDLHREEV